MTRKVVCSKCKTRIPSEPAEGKSFWITKKDTSQERVCEKCYWDGK